MWISHYLAERRGRTGDQEETCPVEMVTGLQNVTNAHIGTCHLGRLSSLEVKVMIWDLGIYCGGCLLIWRYVPL